MKNILLISCFMMSLFIACTNKLGNQKPQTITTSPIDTSLLWIDYRLGELPPQGAYDGIDTLVKKYKLRYQRIEAGCEIGEEEERLKAKYANQNQRYFQEMEKVHGKDWKKQFDEELHVLDSTNGIQLVKQIDSINKREQINFN
ncbi:hypothetical protein LZQ00_03050 [Sphingobacterium sp. SRCM116780]|uniref:hypothetical protein n=1 Tax=Sphingobacterium sp. SRCM116780 TaxID=2907623 RepID=UPI001F28818B|nr:hypothetical protein [Sphingobacterium sp. SRCM116780]UIR56802.1 hypothetical protein LZQ00_03050 [Sphingobacterium sp. SRCM116780]